MQSFSIKERRAKSEQRKTSSRVEKKKKTYDTCTGLTYVQATGIVFAPHIFKSRAYSYVFLFSFLVVTIGLI